MTLDVFEVTKETTLPVRALFYLVTPAESKPETVAQVPDYVTASFPIFLAMMILEVIMGYVKSRKIYAVNDTIASLSAGVMSRLPDLFGKAIEAGLYFWVYDKWHVYELQTNSLWTWIFCLLGFDFLFYWFHRMAHEINLFWTVHQTHHSSEYYNLSTALRQPPLGKYAAMLFYAPLALLVPPPIFLVHMQLNLLYQFWIHTELIDKIGPLEFILNTASHHRVHHGRNPYCIDKNYGGFLIIWDRLFGTFELERSDDKVYYGLVHNIRTFDAFWVHFAPIYDMWRKFVNNVTSKKYHGIDKLKNVLKSIFYGPGWFSKKPHFRLGDRADLPEIEPNPQPFDIPISTWKNVYCCLHFLFSTAVFWLVILSPMPRSAGLSLAVFYGMCLTACSLGYILNGKWFAKWFELARCIAFAFALPTVLAVTEWLILAKGLQVIHGLSLLPWLTLEKSVEITIRKVD